MNITRINSLSKAAYEKILTRSSGMNPTIMPNVRSIMESVKTYGDQILTSERTTSLNVTKKEIQQAYKEVDQSFLNAIEQIIKNITAVHVAQLPTKKDIVISPEQGITVWREWRAIEKIGIYVPGGKALYPSSVLMCAIPASIAGCREIIMCSPPRGNGKIPAPTLVAADMAGIKEIYTVGGAQAIAAMTYGTETIPNVYKIFGAGNSFVTAAKMIAQETISIDMPAGPSEVFIIADETANPAYIAADLLADAEHGEDSACVLITTSEDVARKTIIEIEKQLPGLITGERARESIDTYGLFAVVDSMDTAVFFTNDYAPEHLEIMTKDPSALMSRITNAGSVFLGQWTSKATGDYATGANHVLPTGGMAKMYPPLGVDSFGKWMQVQQCTRDGLKRIQQTIETIADVEQLPAHKNSVSIRFS